jgi:hypothetical protein
MEQNENDSIIWIPYHEAEMWEKIKKNGHRILKEQYYKNMEQNKNDMFEDMRAAGSQLPDIVETLKKRGWKTYEHHDNWIHPNVLGQFTTHQAYDYKGMLGVPVSEAATFLAKTLREDTEYRDTWKANIGICIYDEYMSNFPNTNPVVKGALLEIFNNGADRFLKLLTAEKTTDNE